MTLDCRWMNDNLEAYCCDRLSVDERRLAESHLNDCEACTHELQSLEAVDPLVKNLFRYRLRVAQASPRRRRLLPAAVACALALALVAVLPLKPGAPPPIEYRLAAAPPPVAVEQAVPKSDGPSEVTRSKPEAVVAPSSASSPALDSRPGNPSEAFAVIDQAGYVRRLSDYRGYVLLFGVWSQAQPAAAANLEQLYRTFGNNPKFRLLGVSASRQKSPSGVTFPVVYNQESRLLGALSGDFVVIDASGTEVLRGSLLGNGASLIPGVRAVLQTPAKE